MSELITTNVSRNGFRKHLLATASALVFGACGAAVAQPDNTGRPTVWIELGGQAEFTRGTSSPFIAPFMAANADSGAFDPISPLEVQKTPQFSFGEEGKISIQPQHTDWIFSAALRYGRSGAKRYVHQQTIGFPIPTTAPMFKGVNGLAPQHYMSGEVSYTEDRVRQSESHLLLDFQAGRDVGVGLFGKDGTSIVSAGVRMARLSTGSTTSMRLRPDMVGSNFVSFFKYKRHYHHYSLSGVSERSFRGIGPSFSWNGSAPVIGNPEAGELAVDWGVNAAALFGKQKMQAHHVTTGFHDYAHLSPYARSENPQRSRSVIVPNIGGSMGFSYRFEAAKLDVGYRADLFFNAMDTGMDTRQTSNILFHGPYASLSIGLGG